MVPRHTTRAGRRVGRVLVGLAALAALAALLVAVPMVLAVAWRFLGPPFPTPQELTSPDDGTLFVRVLCLVGWLAWATFLWAVLAEILAAWRGWRLPGPTWQRHIAAGLIAAIAAMLTSPAIASATATPVRAAPAAVAPAVATVSADTVTTTTTATTVEPVTASRYIEHHVRPGEQMPALAERYLGDKYQWHAIAAATYGLAQPDGRVLNPGDTRVYPGWTVRIPTTTIARTAGLTPVAQSTTVDAPVTALVYEVAEDDWMWFIAERFLGDPERYTEIRDLNPKYEKRDGRFPDLILANDRLVLPNEARDRGPRTHATGTIVSPAPPSTGAVPGGPPSAGGAGPGAPSTAPTAPSPSASRRPTATTSPSATASPTRGAASTGQAVPERTPAPQAATPDGHQPGEDDSMLDNALLIGVPLFGAGLLAALLLTVLRRNRRRQEQHRPVGRRLPTPVEPKAETQLRVVAQPVAVERLDHALRVLAAGLADRPTERMPDIVGAWLHGDTVNLLLTQPCSDPPAPWGGNQLNWTLPGDIDLPDSDGQLAPLPTLAAVGSRPGMHLLLDLERLGVLAVTGDQDRADDLLRYLAAELACNAWSDHVEITVAGFDAAETGELIALGGDRIEAAPNIGVAIERIRRRASQVVQSLDHLDAGDPLAGRIADIAADAWMPQVLLAKAPGPDEIAALEALDSDLSAAGRCAVAVVVTTARNVGRWPISVDANGRLTIPFLGMTGDDASLTTAGLPRTELCNLADLLDTARRHTPQPDPAHGANADEGTGWPRVPAAPEVEPWAAGTDAAGGLLHEPVGEASSTTEARRPDAYGLTDDERPAGVPQEPEPAANPIPPPPHAGAETSRTVDEAARVPTVLPLDGSQGPARKTVTAPARRRHSDPTLDADLGAWIDADPTRPRIAILGPATVEASGHQPSERLRFYAEIIIYLAARGARGATADQFDEALWPGQQPQATSRRVAVARARRWLGVTTDGEPWLPDATTDRRYHLRDGYLLDWHLFRRLRSCGEARGPAGAGDLRQALALVRGAPLAGADIAYSPVARNPYPWLPKSEITPYHLAAAVVDTAHRFAELCLDAGDLPDARWAVDQAWLADPDRSSDITWRDLLRVAAAEGNTAELEQILGELIRVREAEVPEDLDKETYRLLCDLMPDRMRAGVR
ncbi:LysM peptidoglycan-binding domain-containing protein [Phytohabitans aurantiacus]|uniref:Membrane protein n=1 Tax=Phytohabitans aurantiacus TaxID=3016789 RepID=A0ABQ5R2H9_9ACTN|nr:LysM peptidoglycan-binding domain-containing protein [Phytohabitans aurantiacus]GLH99795.1 membrane protein [Phytohabitans aurantiacus]